MVACQTLQAAPVLTLEEVDNQTIVAHAVHLPLLLARNLGRKLLKLCLPFWRHLDVWLLEYPVEIFVQTVKQPVMQTAGQSVTKTPVERNRNRRRTVLSCSVETPDDD